MDSKLVGIWHKYLDRGMHLSPVADQDNHRISWGTRTKARTGVWVNGPMTRDAVLLALRDGRAFASEDPHLRVWFSINGQPMGSRLADPGESDLSIVVRVTDAEEPNARYIATLFHDTPGDDELPLNIEESDQLKNGEAWRVTREHMPGINELFMVHVRQVETTGSHVDDSWTAPIWIETTGGVTPDPDEPMDEGFVRSKNSKIYHFKNCAMAQQIEANGNLVPHTPKQGDGTRLHKNCPTSHH